MRIDEIDKIRLIDEIDKISSFKDIQNKTFPLNDLTHLRTSMRNFSSQTTVLSTTLTQFNVFRKVL